MRVLTGCPAPHSPDSVMSPPPRRPARRTFRDIDVRQNETGFDVEGAQHLGRLAVGEIVEASSERLAIDRDDASRRIGNGAAQTGGDGGGKLLDGLRIKPLEE